MSETAFPEADAEEILLYFDIGSYGLDAQSFAYALLAFDELYRAIDDVANPGRDIEVEFVRSDQGSLRAVIRVVTKDSKNLLKAPISLMILPFLLGILVNKITSDEIRIVVSDEYYVVEKGGEKIVLPKSAKPLEDKVEEDPAVRRTLSKFFSVVESEPNIKSVDFRVPQSPDFPIVPIQREKFASLRDLPEIVDEALPKFREQQHARVSVVVVTAILAKTKRKWEFLWSGNKISAEIRDDSFFEKLANHEYEFGQGDALQVDLVAKQELNFAIKAYENKSFYISKVHKHTKGLRQPALL